jgi:hypothetical protein
VLWCCTSPHSPGTFPSPMPACRLVLVAPCSLCAFKGVRLTSVRPPVTHDPCESSAVKVVQPEHPGAFIRTMYLGTFRPSAGQVAALESWDNSFHVMVRRTYCNEHRWIGFFVVCYVLIAWHGVVLLLLLSFLVVTRRGDTFLLQHKGLNLPVLPESHSSASLIFCCRMLSTSAGTHCT